MYIGLGKSYVRATTSFRESKLDMASPVWSPTFLSFGCHRNLSSSATYLAAARQSRHYAFQSPKTSHIFMTSKVPLTSRSVASLAATSSGNSGGADEGREPTKATIQKSIIRQEDTIILSLIERAQYPMNLTIYDANLFTVPGFDGTFLEYMLKETERLHAKMGRYTNPDEHPFFPDDLPKSLLPPMQFPRFLHKAADQINRNPLVWEMYFDILLPLITYEGDDGNYGSAATCDILCLQSLSKSIHFGKFVAEAEFRESRHLFEPLIRAQDVEALYKFITVEEDEEDVLRRIETKAVAYGTEVYVDETAKQVVVDSTPQALKVDSKLVGLLYWGYVMRLTKRVQVEYLLHRLD